MEAGAEVGVEAHCEELSLLCPHTKNTCPKDTDRGWGPMVDIEVYLPFVRTDDTCPKWAGTRAEVGAEATTEANVRT